MVTSLASYRKHTSLSLARCPEFCCWKDGGGQEAGEEARQDVGGGTGRVSGAAAAGGRGKSAEEGGDAIPIPQGTAWEDILNVQKYVWLHDHTGYNSSDTGVSIQYISKNVQQSTQ